MLLSSFETPFDVVIAGGTGGIGRAFVDQLSGDDSVRRVWVLSRREPETLPAGAYWLRIDLEDETSIERATQNLKENAANLRLVISAVGVLHDGESLQPEKTWRSLSADAMQRNFAINAIGPALLAKHLLPLMPREGKSVFAALSARVGSISDNRMGGWYSYRASKAALNMIIKSLAIEWSRKAAGSICIGLHPGTVATDLSAPFRGGTAPEKLFEPAYSASCLLKVIDDRGANDSGRCFAWDGQEVEA